MTDRLTYSVTETAQLLGISRNLCYEQIRQGVIPALKLGKRVLIPKAKLDMLVEGQNDGKVN